MLLGTSGFRISSAEFSVEGLFRLQGSGQDTSTCMQNQVGIWMCMYTRSEGVGIHAYKYTGTCACTQSLVSCWHECTHTHTHTFTCLYTRYILDEQGGNRPLSLAEIQEEEARQEAQMRQMRQVCVFVDACVYVCVCFFFACACACAGAGAGVCACVCVCVCVRERERERDKAQMRGLLYFPAKRSFLPTYGIHESCKIWRPSLANLIMHKYWSPANAATILYTRS